MSGANIREIKMTEQIKDEVGKAILFYKPEISIYTHENHELMCEVDMFNDHILYFIRERVGVEDYFDYEPVSDYRAALAQLIELIEQENKNESTHTNSEGEERDHM